ncbi:hypothetical protein ILUMI_13648 [Ignelater luminosus]|uniref:DUF5641 domain-containing protein n=1 Tax=Ignelater luminosus TaxID=2038154 RepID=A0A8K0CWC4_IGNLU|nr:hypothetical protein ILUMI_13648 [Ignelater luminosus]
MRGVGIWGVLCKEFGCYNSQLPLILPKVTVDKVKPKDGNISSRDDDADVSRMPLVYKVVDETLIKNIIIRSVGGQPALSTAEEVAIVDAMVKCADWWFLLDLLDLRMLTKAYLDSCGRLVATQSNAKPGDQQEPAIKGNLTNRFYATGIHPLNVNKVLDRIPGTSNDPRPTVDDTLLQLLREDLFRQSKQRIQRKRKRIHVVPGKSVATANSSSSDKAENTVDHFSESALCEREHQVAEVEVVKVHPDEDGVVRVVTVKTTKGLLRRPTAKICPLPLHPNGQ